MQFADITTIPAAMAALKIWIIGTAAFLLAMAWTPLLTHFLYKYKIGVKIKKESVDGEKAPVYHSLHKGKSGTPTMGGALVWVTVLVLAVIFFLIKPYFELKIITRLDFLSRSQTWLPFFALITTAVVGAFDDIFRTRPALHLFGNLLDKVSRVGVELVSTQTHRGGVELRPYASLSPLP